MTIQLLSVLSAAALAATGLAPVSETRSAQSLPAAVPHLVVTPAPAGSAGKSHMHAARHLADAAATAGSDEGACAPGDTAMACTKSSWWKGSGVRLLIGAGAVAGIVVAARETSNNSVSH